MCITVHALFRLFEPLLRCVEETGGTATRFHRLPREFTFPLCFVKHRSEAVDALSFLLYGHDSSDTRVIVVLRLRRGLSRSRNHALLHRGERIVVIFFRILFCPPRVTAVRFQCTNIYRRGKGTLLLRSFEQPISIMHDDLRPILPYSYTSFARIFFVYLGFLRDTSRFCLSLFLSIVSLLVPSRICV